MLWSNLLQNTRYCDTLKGTTYRLYSVKEYGFARGRWKLTRLLILNFALTFIQPGQLADHPETKGGLLWIAPLLP